MDGSCDKSCCSSQGKLVGSSCRLSSQPKHLLVRLSYLYLPVCVHHSPHGDVGCRAGITTCCRVSIWRRFSASSPRRSRTLLRANWVVHPTVTHGPCSLIVCYDTLSAAVAPSAHFPRCFLPAVNAYYDAPTNSLTIPAGILQYPCECSFSIVPYHDVDDGFHCCWLQTSRHRMTQH
jgi:hypothetical protein